LPFTKIVLHASLSRSGMSNRGPHAAQLKVSLLCMYNIMTTSQLGGGPQFAYH